MQGGGDPATERDLEQGTPDLNRLIKCLNARGANLQEICYCFGENFLV